MASDRSTKDKEMAAHLKRMGIFHGSSSIRRI
jgi:hypothetical protein